MNFHLINFSGLLLALTRVASEKSLIAKKILARIKSNREEARELFITNGIKLQTCGIF